jgi:hypothetical protein
MLEHAALQQRSGKTLVSYANLIGVSRHKMHYWVRKYKASQKKVKNDTSLKFIDLGSFGLKDQPVSRILIPGGHLVLGCLNVLSKFGKNKHQDKVYKHARFFTPTEIEHFLSHFGTPRMSFGIYYSPEFELLDGTESQDYVEPAFIAASVQKTN